MKEEKHQKQQGKAFLLKESLLKGKLPWLPLQSACFSLHDSTGGACSLWERRGAWQALASTQEAGFEEEQSCNGSRNWAYSPWAELVSSEGFTAQQNTPLIPGSPLQPTPHCARVWMELPCKGLTHHTEHSLATALPWHCDDTEARHTVPSLPPTAHAVDWQMWRLLSNPCWLSHPHHSHRQTMQGHPSIKTLLSSHTLLNATS